MNVRGRVDALVNLSTEEDTRNWVTGRKRCERKGRERLVVALRASDIIIRTLTLLDC